MSCTVRSARPGHTYFFTVRAARRGDDLFVRNIDVLRRATRKTLTAWPFEIEEIVVLPDVIHTLWTLPEGDTQYSRRWRMLKSLFSRAVDMPVEVNAQNLRPGEKGVWQRRFWEHCIRDSDDLAAHRHMILHAPVQAGLVSRPEQWQHSSIHRAMARGTYAPLGPPGPAHGPAAVGPVACPPYGAVAS